MNTSNVILLAKRFPCRTYKLHINEHSRKGMGLADISIMQTFVRGYTIVTTRNITPRKRPTLF